LPLVAGIVFSPPVYDTLLFLHILCAFLLISAIVMYSAFVLGGPVSHRTALVAGVLSAVGGMGVLIFGIWLAIYVKGIEPWDGWVIAAIVTWAAGFALSSQPEKAINEATGDEVASVSISSRATVFHWASSAMFVVLLVIMVWKPGA
jgi:uncharacterized protein (DUF697 family)